MAKRSLLESELAPNMQMKNACVISGKQQATVVVGKLTEAESIRPKLMQISRRRRRQVRDLLLNLEKENLHHPRSQSLSSFSSDSIRED
jgi:hypothetical protein